MFKILMKDICVCMSLITYPRPAPSMAGVVVVGDIVAADAVVNMQEPEPACVRVS